ncbi:DUF6950 family protein [Rhizobium grahamii]|uniref:DUF6950 domain-containing protein n=1 Tax=Rhizobium grahamii CCGE 502 TaxID=990285 RepID=S3HR34_9HYPH|nr:hypothetical protein [Rhizobium grahamii]EPE95706.1 hypothetical protein RGCCGE502_22690 [Rhizobium grahamii CCGE 502]
MAELRMTELLSAFLDEYRIRPWNPGVDVDCCLFLAEWAMVIGHPDPAAHLRGTYSDEAGFREIIIQAGGAVAIVEGCTATINAKRVQQPAPGDIGVIGSPTNIFRQFGAIFDGERWLVRYENSIGPLAATSLAIWRL